MINRKGIPKLLAVAITLMIFISGVQGTAKAQDTELDPIVVMYEASHTPQFSANNAEDGLKLMLDMVNESTRYLLRVNEDPLNDTILENVDILIIAEPDESVEFEYEEILAIDELLTNGSSLFILGDPSIDQNSTYWSNQQFRDLGENVAINTFLDQMNITTVRFGLNETASGRIFSDTMFDYEQSLNSTYASIIQFDSTTWDTSHPIFKDINSIISMTATLKPIDLVSGIAHGYETSFAQYRRGPNTFGNLTFPNMSLQEFQEAPNSYSAINGTFPSWLSAFRYGNSRIVVGGSALMFTGRKLDFPESEGEWFYQADNSRLFMNILSWLSYDFVNPESPILPMLIISSVILLIGVAYYLFKRLR